MLADTLMLIILGTALWRRPSVVNVALTFSWLASIFLSDIRQHEALRPLLMANDAFLVVVLALTKKWERNEYLARVVASFSMVSIAAGFCAAVGEWSWNTYAATVNSLAVVQALFAGGYGDGILAWLGDRSGQHAPRGSLHRRFMGVFR